MLKPLDLPDLSGLAVEADVLVTVVTVHTVETGMDVVEAFVTVDGTTLGPDWLTGHILPVI